MRIELFISLSSLVISVLSVAFVYRQIRDSTKATKVQLTVSLIDQLYSDKLVQEMLELVINDKISFKADDGVASLTCTQNSEERNIYLEINMLLNRLQVLGLSYHLGIFSEHDLRGIKFEVIKVGRNDAIRSYLKFLNDDYQKSSGVEHDHFDSLKQLYLALENNSAEAQRFKEQCLFRP